MIYILTVDFKILRCMILQRLYGFIASITFFLFKIYHPFVVDKIKKAKIDELKKSIQLLQKNNQMNESVLTITRQGLEKIQSWPEYEDAECRKSHEHLMISIRRNLEEAETRKAEMSALIVEVQSAITRLQKAKKIVIQPERNFWYYHFMIAQLRKRKFLKLVKLYSGFNCKFF